MGRYRKKPAVVEAEQFWPGEIPWPEKVHTETLVVADFGKGTRYTSYFVTTIHGQKTKVAPGDWIIIESDGIHAYPCKPDIFEATYETVEDE